MDIVTLIQNLGFPTAVALFVLVFLIKQYRDAQNFIKNYLVKIIENNTKAIEQLVFVINEMRHELKEKQDTLQKSLEEQKNILIEIKSKLEK